MIRIQVQKNQTETTTSLLRRFSKRVQGAGLIREAKSHRYHERAKSSYVKQKLALGRLKRRREIEKLRKLGKLPDAPKKKFH